MEIILAMLYTKVSRFGFLLFCSLLAIASAPARAGVSVTLSWNGNAESDLAGYRVHYGTLAAPYTQMVDVQTTSTEIPNLVAGKTYLFAVTAYNTAGVESGYSSPIAYFATTAPYGGQRVTLDNISSRVSVQTGDNVMIGGFIVQGNAPKTLVLRALGPSLAEAGVAGAISDPVLEIHKATGALLASNDGWNGTDAQTLTALGLAPKDRREAALVMTLPAGAYSAVVRGKNGGRGVALFELYNLDRAQGSVANISTRGRVESGDQVMIGGFIVGGSTTTKVIVRAIGPSLVRQGVADALVDPTLELYDSDGTLLSSNDNWRSKQEGAIIDSTVPPSDDREAAIVRTLPPGAYSAVIRGQDGKTGVALFEVYAIEQ